MSEQPPPPPRSPTLTTAPTTPAVHDALRALGPDYEEALVASIAARVDALARQREAVGGPSAPSGGKSGNPSLTVTILSLIFGMVLTIVALTAGLAIAGPVALLAILIVWIGLVAINFAVWNPRRQ